MKIPVSSTHRFILCLLTSFFLFTTNESIAQTFQANYQVTRNMSLSAGAPTAGKTLALAYDGLLYSKGNRTISFCRPLYLDEYPTGTVEVDNPEGGTVTNNLHMDSVQALAYVDLDSMIMRNRSDGSGRNLKRTNTTREFEWGIRKWHLLPDTKIISGLSCQKAVLYRSGGSGEIVYEIWFCPDIGQQAGPRGLTDLPGLVVELQVVPFDEHWSLQSYVFNTPLSDSLFWPNEFNEPFKRLAKLGRRD